MVTKRLKKWFLFKYKIQFLVVGCCKMINPFVDITSALLTEKLFFLLTFWLKEQWV